MLKIINNFLLSSFMGLFCFCSSKEERLRSDNPEPPKVQQHDQLASPYLTLEQAQENTDFSKAEIEKVRQDLESQFIKNETENQEKIKNLEKENQSFKDIVKYIEERASELQGLKAELDTIKLLLKDTINSEEVQSNIDTLLANSNKQTIEFEKSINEIKTTIRLINDSFLAVNTRIDDLQKNSHEVQNNHWGAIESLSNRLNCLQQHLDNVHNHHLDAAKKLADAIAYVSQRLGLKVTKNY